jgi:hypothetical protein
MLGHQIKRIKFKKDISKWRIFMTKQAESSTR